MIKPNIKPIPSLIQPRDIFEDPRKAFRQVPYILRNWHFTDREDLRQGVTVTLGHKHPISFKLSLDQFAALILLVQVGVPISTGSNGGKRPNYYARLRTDEGNPIPLCRFFYDVGAYESVRFREDRTDLRFENLLMVPKGRPVYNARMCILPYAEILAKQAVRYGRLPEGITAADYMDNLHRILATIDSERVIGTHLPDIPKVDYYPSSSLAA